MLCIMQAVQYKNIDESSWNLCSFCFFCQSSMREVCVCTTQLTRQQLVGTREEVPEMVPRGFKASEKSNSRVNKQD